MTVEQRVERFTEAAAPVLTLLTPTVSVPQDRDAGRLRCARYGHTA